MLTNNNEKDPNLQQRLTYSTKEFFCMLKKFSYKLLQKKKTKIHMYKTIIRSMLLYGFKNWEVRKRTDRCLKAPEIGE